MGIVIIKHQNYHHYHHHFHRHFQLEFDSVTRAYMSFLTAEKKDHAARCPARRGGEGGWGDLSWQCPFKNNFSAWMSSLRVVSRYVAVAGLASQYHSCVHYNTFSKTKYVRVKLRLFKFFKCFNSELGIHLCKILIITYIIAKICLRMCYLPDMIFLRD